MNYRYLVKKARAGDELDVAVLLQYLDTVSWVFRPVKPTTESENRLQLGSLSTSVNIDHLTTVDNTSAVGNDSRPWVVTQSIKWLSTITRERLIPPDPESGGFPYLFGTFLSPHIGSAWRARHDNNNNNWLISDWHDTITGRYARCLGFCWTLERWLMHDKSWRHVRSLLVLTRQVCC